MLTVFFCRPNTDLPTLSNCSSLQHPQPTQYTVTNPDPDRRKFPPMQSVRSPEPLKLSNMQWYMARSHHVVYLALLDTGITSNEALRGLVGQLLKLEPRLLAHGDLDTGETGLGKLSDTLAAVQFVETADIHTKLQRELSELERPFIGGRRPWFRAVGYRQPDTGKSLLLFSAPHAVMEGLDSQRLTRGKKALPIVVPTAKIGDQLIATLWTLLAIPAAAGHHLLARIFHQENRRYSRHLVTIDYAATRHNARFLGISTRNYLFACVLAALRFQDSGKWNLRAKARLTYSYFSTSTRALDDPGIKLQMAFVSLNASTDFEAFARHCTARLAQEPNRRFQIQHFYNAAFSVHRVLAKLVPRLYRHSVFTYVPADFLLTLLPPNRVDWPQAGLGGGSIHTGSNTPGINSCIFCPNGTEIHLSLNLDDDHVAKLDRLVSFFNARGIVARRV